MWNFKGKKVLVTGGTAGIGKEIAAAFAHAGADVAIFGTNEQRAKETVDSLQQQYPEQKMVSYLVDVANKDSVYLAIQQVLADLGAVDVLVNNAGITKDTLLMKMSEEEWDQVLDTNLKSVYNTCQSLIRVMLKARSGAIINISSVVGLMGNPGQTNYAASKAGMIGFTKALAKEVASRGITVNCIAPGFIRTKMTDALTPEQQKEILAQVPMGKWGECSDIAQAALFLAKAPYVTGQVLVVDGGMAM